MKSKKQCFPCAVKSTNRTSHTIVSGFPVSILGMDEFYVARPFRSKEGWFVGCRKTGASISSLIKCFKTKREAIKDAREKLKSMEITLKKLKAFRSKFIKENKL